MTANCGQCGTLQNGAARRVWDRCPRCGASVTRRRLRSFWGVRLLRGVRLAAWRLPHPEEIGRPPDADLSGRGA